MKHKVNVDEAGPVGNKCQHYWVIATPEGPKSRGICLLCGEERDFYNSWRYVEATGEPAGRR